MQIFDLIEKEPLTALDLSKRLGVGEKEIYSNLPHIEKSAKSKGKRLRMKPYQCIMCGFTFKGRKHYHPPSRCPLCKEERILTAFFSIY
jgi:predicted Zn-ribbon and HTH transcriptional regulator